MHLLNRAHAHQLSDALLVGVGTLGEPLLGAAALLGILLMIGDTDAGGAWTGAAMVIVLMSAALIIARVRR